MLERKVAMKPVYDLCEAVSDFDSCIELDLAAMHKRANRLRQLEKTTQVKDVCITLKDMYKILTGLESDTSKYKDWLEKEIDSTEKGAGD